jgi:hypothetical protein
MFGSPPPPLCPSLFKSPVEKLEFDDASIADYGIKLQSITRALREATQKHHKVYLRTCKKPPPPPTPVEPLSVGDIVLILRPRRTKLMPPNSGPYLVISIQKHTATLRNVATNLQTTEHLSNIRRFAAMGNIT